MGLLHSGLHQVNTVKKTFRLHQGHHSSQLFTMDLLKVAMLLSLCLLVTSSVLSGEEENIGNVIQAKKGRSVKTELSTTMRCSTSFCGWNHGSCCSSYYCVGLGASPGSCLKCSTSFCGWSHASCCSGYYCVGLGASPGSCMRCAGRGRFCYGGNHPPCCSGLFCSGAGAGPGTCT